MKEILYILFIIREFIKRFNICIKSIKELHTHTHTLFLTLKLLHNINFWLYQVLIIHL